MTLIRQPLVSGVKKCIKFEIKFLLGYKKASFAICFFFSYSFLQRSYSNISGKLRNDIFLILNTFCKSWESANPSSRQKIINLRFAIHKIRCWCRLDSNPWPSKSYYVLLTITRMQPISEKVRVSKSFVKMQVCLKPVFYYLDKN